MAYILAHDRQFNIFENPQKPEGKAEIAYAFYLKVQNGLVVESTTGQLVGLSFEKAKTDLEKQGLRVALAGENPYNRINGRTVHFDPA